MKIQYARVALDSGNLDHAKLLASAVIHDYPDNPKIAADAHAILGRVLLKTNEDTKAKQQFEAAVALDPTFENGYELAVADLDLGDGPGAAKIFSEMLSSFGDTATIHMYFGQAYGRSDFQDDAVAEFKKAIAADDKLPGVHYSLAAAYLSTSGNSKLPEAEAELKKEIALSPKYAPPYAALGHLLAQQHDPATQPRSRNRSQARDRARPHQSRRIPLPGPVLLGRSQASRSRSRSSSVHRPHQRRLAKCIPGAKRHTILLGRLLMQTGQPEEGKKEVAISQSLLQQNLQRDQNQLSDYLQTKRAAQNASTLAPEMPMTIEDHTVDPEAAHQVDQLEKQLGPAIADSYNNLGAIAGSQGNYVSALQSFEHAAEWNSALPGLDINWGRAAFSAGAFAQAVAPLSHYLQANPTDNDVRAELGLSQFSIKDYAAARRTLEPLNDTAGEAPRLQFAYAASLIETGEISTGVAQLSALEKTNPNVGEVHRALGEAYAKEKSAGASAELETAIRLDPSDAEAHIALARLKLAQGNKSAAITHFQAALKLEPGNQSLQKELADVSSATARH